MGCKGVNTSVGEEVSEVISIYKEEDIRREASSFHLKEYVGDDTGSNDIVKEGAEDATLREAHLYKECFTKESSATVLKFDTELSTNEPKM